MSESNPAAVAPPSAPIADCTLCFNLRSHWRDSRRRCQEHGGINEWGEVAVSPPETTAPTATPMDERVVRHPNGHLMIERTPMYVPSQEEEDTKHASHIDGEFDLAHGEVRRMFKAFRARIAAVSSVASSATPTPEARHSETSVICRECGTLVSGEEACAFVRWGKVP